MEAPQVEKQGEIGAGPPTAARLGRALGGRLPVRGQRIGLLGGSFNPAHGGHRHISLEALKRLQLDEVWWLVSPQNPLKPRDGMASFAERAASARTIAGRHQRLRVTALESALGTRYTRDTLRALAQRFPGVRFVWLMGADNLGQFHRWAGWTEIFYTFPVAVLDRPSYSIWTGAAKAAHRFRQARVPDREAGRLAAKEPPAWVFLRQPRDPRSATAIRAQKAKDEGAPCHTPKWSETPRS